MIKKLKVKHLKVPCKCGHRSTGYTEKDFDENLVHKGAKVEFEHTCDKELAERIAMDHLSEGLDYYERLEEMERKLSEGKKLHPDKRKICKHK